MRAIPTPFVDMLFILIAYLLLMIAPDTKKELEPQPKQLAEFIINVTWSGKANSDVDVWIMRAGNPQSVTGYRKRENDVFILHNDNTSSRYGQIDGKELEVSREVMTIERIKEDYYMLSLHGYNIRTTDDAVKVRIEIQKSKPFSHILTKEVIVISGEELPIAAWNIDADGNVVPNSMITDETLLEKFL